MLMIDCTFALPEDFKPACDFFRKNAGKISQYFGTVFNSDPSEVTIMRTTVLSRRDQAYSTNCAALNFALSANPSVTTSIDADQLRDWLLERFPELQHISFAVIYMTGITAPSRTYARHL